MNLNELQFKHKEQAGKHYVEAKHGGQSIGMLSWHKEKTVPHPLTGLPLAGTITDVSVDAEHRRQGVATAMWKYGQQFNPPPAHSPSRTPINRGGGDAWARSVGGDLPPTYAMLNKSQAEREAMLKIEPMTGSW